MQLVLDFNKGIIKEKQQKVYQHLGEERITFVTYLNGNKIKYPNMDLILIGLTPVKNH